VTIVSGLPRSGTSLLMQMLAAAGLPLAADAERPPDPDNPRGYFELAAVKRLRSGAEFLADCVGRVVKIVAPLVLELPPRPARRILFVERPLEELLASQRAMLARQGIACDAGQERALAGAFEALLARCRAALAAPVGAGDDPTPVLFVAHRRLVRAPGEAAEEIARFLAGTGTGEETEDRAPAAARRAARATDAMVRAVDPTLYRQRRD